MPAAPDAVDRLTRAIRACFGRLGALADDLHRDLGLTASQRAVVEFLFETGEHTVPQIARAKRVSRQHIQVLVDTLIPSGLVALRDNPAHKRSPLVTLTARGRRTFEVARAREAVLLAELAGRLDARDLDATLATLDRVRAAIEDRLAPGGDDDET
jgi:DNA-binding MarR family transcriptional regulator